jgi:hypothetical protein
VATVSLKAKTTGTKQVTFDKSYNSEMTGMDIYGKSIAFSPIAFGSSNSISVGQAALTCGCTNGAPKDKGDANCDNLVNSLDFETWRNEMFDKGGINGTVSKSWKANFNCPVDDIVTSGNDWIVSGIDFEIWRKTVFN